MGNNYKLKNLINDLIYKAILSFSPNSKPGSLIKNLSKEKRDLLKTATSDDFNHRIR